MGDRVNIAVESGCGCCGCVGGSLVSLMAQVSRSKCGVPANDVPGEEEEEYQPPKVYKVRRETISGSWVGTGVQKSSDDCVCCRTVTDHAEYDWGGVRNRTYTPEDDGTCSFVLDPTPAPSSTSSTRTYAYVSAPGQTCSESGSVDGPYSNPLEWDYDFGSGFQFPTIVEPTVTTATTVYNKKTINGDETDEYEDACGCENSSRVFIAASLEETIELLEEDTTDAVVARAEAALAAATTFTSGGMAIREVSTDEKTVLLAKFKYEFAHPVPTNGNGRCLRAEWVERTVPKLTRNPETNAITGGGASVTSLEILDKGCFRPTVNVLPEEGGSGSGAELVAVMSPSGSVSSIRVLNPGQDYRAGTTIEIDASWVEDGTDATATPVIDLDEESPNYGRILSVNVGSGGNYRPKITFTAPATGGVKAEATCTLDPRGGLASVAITNGGSRYHPLVASPGIGIGGVFVHWGSETPRCYKWDGNYDEEDYNASTPATWPRSAEYTVPAPGEEAVTLLELKRVVCDCKPCGA